MSKLQTGASSVCNTEEPAVMSSTVVTCGRYNTDNSDRSVRVRGTGQGGTGQGNRWRNRRSRLDAVGSNVLPSQVGPANVWYWIDYEGCAEVLGRKIN